MLDQTSVDGGFELDTGLVVHDDLLDPWNIGAPEQGLKT
jgi:hypothetical protein